MKPLLAKATLIALLTGPAVGLLSTIARTKVSHKYDPPISQMEWEQWKGLPVDQMQAKLRQREVPYTKLQWLSESVRYGYFWKEILLSSVIPTIGVFLACVCVGHLQRRAQLPSS